MNELKIFSGNSNSALASEIAVRLGMELGKIEVGRFPEGEIKVKINENVRGADVFVVQSTCAPVNENVMELLIMLDAFRRASAKRLTVVIPYYGYARQDRKDQPRVPITAKLMANLIAKAGANRILTMDLHADQVQGFFDMPLDHLIGSHILSDYFGTKKIQNLVVATTDVGGIKLARNFAERLKAPLAIVDKRRMGPSQVEALNLIGDVKGKNVIIPDDIIATAGTLSEAVKFLQKQGAKELYACCSHPVLCGNAVQRIKDSALKQLVVTNTIPLGNIEPIKDRVVVLSVAELFAEAVKRIHNEESISSLFL